MATNTAASFTNHTGNGTAGPFNVSFSYLSEAEVDVTVGGVLKTITTHYTFTSATQITFTSGNEPGNGVAIKFQRDTNLSSKAVDFNDGSVLTEADLDTNADQLLFGMQEIVDSGVGSSVQSVSGTTPIVSSGGTTPAISISAATTSAAGSMSASDKTKLDGIEASATADQTASEIRTLVESASDSNVFTDADHTKLNAIEANATADQTASEIKTAYESNSDTNAFTDAEKTKLTSVESNATADQTNSEIKTAYEANSDTNAFTDAEKTKLSGIEASADVTDATNVNAAGAVMNSDTSTTAMNFVVDEDNMSSNSATKVPTQQSVKAYVDTEVAGVVDSAPSALNTLNELAAALGDDANFSTTVTNSIGTKLPLGGGTMTGNIVMSGSQTVDGRDLSVDGAKLDNIEANADVTDATNVNAAGAVMNSDLDGKGELLVGDGSGDPTALAAGTDGYVLKANSSTATGLEWSAAGSGGDANQNAFSTIAVSGQSNVVADSTTDTLNIVAGSNVTITSNVGSDTITFSSTDTNTTDLASDSSPQLAANLDVQTNQITTSTSNGNIKLNPNGTGFVEIFGDGSSADGTIQLNCSQNSHGVKIKSPPHSAGASYTLTLPDSDGNANQVLKTDGSGGLSWVDQTTDTNTQLSNAQVRAAVEAATDSNVFTDADHSKLNAIEASATADQTASEIKTLLQSDKLTVNEIADDAITADKLANSINTEIAANTAKTSNATHTGEVTGSTTLTIADNVVDEANLKVSNSPTDGYVLTAQSGNTGGLTWAAQSGGGGGASAINDLSDAKTDNSGETIGIGSGALAADDGTNQTIAIGKDALNDQTSGLYNCAIGVEALSKITNTGQNMAFGVYAGRRSTGSDNVFIGYSAGEGASSGTISGSNNFAMGVKSMEHYSGSSYNIGIGPHTLRNVSTGGSNIAIGYYAGDAINAGVYNTLIGYNAGTAMTSADDCVALGYKALESLSTSDDNTAIGAYALQLCTNQANTALGRSALALCTTGQYNSAFGKHSLAKVAGGSHNVGFGQGAGNDLTSGDYNVCIGKTAGWQSGNSNNLSTGSNNILIGYESIPSASGVDNEITLGNTNIDKFRIPGINFILKDNGGTPTQGHVLTVDANGEASFAAASGGGGGGKLTLISSTTFTDAATVTFTSISGYLQYKIFFVLNMYNTSTLSNAGVLKMRVGINGTYDTGNNYNKGGNSDTSCQILGGFSAKSKQGEILITHLNEAKATKVHSIGIGESNDASDSNFQTQGAGHRTTTAQNCLQIFGASGNIPSGTISLYGIATS
jgi:hypothetical protein